MKIFVKVELGYGAEQELQFYVKALDSHQACQKVSKAFHLAGLRPFAQRITAYDIDPHAAGDHGLHHVVKSDHVTISKKGAGKGLVIVRTYDRKNSFEIMPLRKALDSLDVHGMVVNN